MKSKTPAMQRPNTKGVLRRVIKSVFHFYPKMFTVSLVCLVFNAVVSSLPSLFMQTVYNAIADAVAGNQPAGNCYSGFVHSEYFLLHADCFR